MKRIDGKPVGLIICSRLLIWFGIVYLLFGLSGRMFFVGHIDFWSSIFVTALGCLLICLGIGLARFSQLARIATICFSIYLTVVILVEDIMPLFFRTRLDLMTLFYVFMLLLVVMPLIYLFRPHIRAIFKEH